MYQVYLERRKLLRNKFLKKEVYVSNCKTSKSKILHVKSSIYVSINGTYFFLNSKSFDSKDKVCNDEWTDICEDYDSELEAGQQVLLNYESNQNENADEFFISVPVDQVNSDDDCDICLEKLNNGNTVSKLTRCVHVFHTECIQKASEFTQRCPICRVCGPNMEGNCPPGRMTWKVIDNLKETPEYESCEDMKEHLAGYEDCKVIKIEYEMNEGFQDDRHPNPGVWYDGTSRDAYLPDNSEGNRVLEMLKVAWKMKKTFTIGRSLTSGMDNQITWNDIHHKTNAFPNTQFGYPDATYLTRVVEDMKAMGIC